MRIVWPSATEYRAFFAPSIQQVTVVSSNLVDDAVGRKVSDGLLMVVDTMGNFCDLELNLAAAQRLNRPLTAEDPTKVDTVIETVVDIPSQVMWFLDESSGYLSFTLDSVDETNWFQVGTGSLIIGVGAAGTLRAIVFHGVAEDTEGELELAWLDRIEKLTAVPDDA